MSRIRQNSIVKKSGHCLETDVDSEVVLMHLEAGHLFSLSGTGRRTWELISDGVSVGEITASLLNEYDVSRTVCENEVAALLAQLHERTFIEID